MRAENDLTDTRVRLAVFTWLEEQTSIHGDVLPWSLLATGFQFDGTRVPLVSQQGIFKPRVLPYMPLSLRTAAAGPYQDHFADDSTLIYAYRGTDRSHPDNERVREAMRRHVPLVYLHAVVPTRYLVVWPVYVVGDDPGALRFTVVADERSRLRRFEAVSIVDPAAGSPEAELRRRYVTRDVRQRLHQRGFRERVLAAYRQQCALCHLRHTELLEAAHILPDSDPDSEPIVPNGLALCRLHHGAFDAYLIGVRPDYRVEVRQSVLRESDGPMLRYGLQSLHEQHLSVPRAPELRPNPDFLDRRYERFRKAS